MISRISDLLFSSPLNTLYAFGCTIILCVIFQIFFLLRANKKEGKKLSLRHFVWVFVLLFYLMMVYQVTGMGTVWNIGQYPELIRWGEISLIPFGDYDGIVASRMTYVLNIMMTIPLGFLLPLIWKGFRSLGKVALTKIALIGFCFSLAIELSQLLNRRATTTDDLIMNTLGVVVGCLIFMLLYKMFRKRDPITLHKEREEKAEFRKSSPIIRYEPVFYLVLSFLGMFLFYNPFAVFSGKDYSNYEMERVDDAIVFRNEEGEVVEEWKVLEDESSEEGFMSANLREITDTTLKVYKNIFFEVNGGTVMWNSTEEITILIGETTFEIWRTNARGTTEPVISSATVDDLRINDTLEVYGRDEGERFVAEKVVIFRFDG